MWSNKMTIHFILYKKETLHSLKLVHYLCGLKKNKTKIHCNHKLLVFPYTLGLKMFHIS